MEKNLIMTKVYMFWTKFLPVLDDWTWLWAPCLLEFVLAILQPFSFDSNKVVTLLWDEQTLSADLNNIFPRDSLLHNLHIFILWYVSSCHKVFQFQDLAYI